MYFKKIRSNILLFVFFLVAFQAVDAQVKLPSFFSDHMVLQQNNNVPIWGSDTPGSSITVEAGWGERYTTRSDSEGRWKVKIKTPYGSETPYDIIIGGSTTLHLKNVLIGEVWFCSGQSNMEMPMKGFNNSPVSQSALFLKEAENPAIRLFNTERAGSLLPENDVIGSWKEADSTSVSNFSAVGYLFGKKLYKELKVPIGIIESSWGGTRIQAWLPMETVLGDPNVEIAKELPEDPNARKLPTQIYNGMVHPFQDYTVKGVLWYQGETNRSDPWSYKSFLHKLTESWRAQWGQNKLPFYIVQIAPYAYEEYRETPAYKAALIREAQLQATFEIPFTGLVVTSDLGDCADIHPPKKEPIAQRLSFWALHNDYGYTNISHASPSLASSKVENKGIQLYFKSESNEEQIKITSSGKPISGFTIAGSDKVFYPADATISEDGSLFISSGKVLKPVAVRYGFVDCLKGNLYGPSMLPLSPFRTDNWSFEP